MIKALKQLNPETLEALSDNDIINFIRIGETYNLNNATVITAKLLMLQNNFTPHEISNLCKARTKNDSLALWFCNSEDISKLKLQCSDEFARAISLIYELAKEKAATLSGDLFDEQYVK